MVAQSEARVVRRSPRSSISTTSLLALVALQQRVGCTTGCIYPVRIARVVDASVHAIVLADCPLDTADPSLTALQRYVRLDARVQQAGGSDTEVRLCEHALLGVLIARQPTTTAVPTTLAELLTCDIASDPTLHGLSELVTIAQQLGFPDLQNRLSRNWTLQCERQRRHWSWPQALVEFDRVVRRVPGAGLPNTQT